MARTFNGSTQYLEGTGAVLNALPCTMACWFRAANITVDLTVCSLGTLGSNSRAGLFLMGSVAGDYVSPRVTNSAGTAAGANTTTGYSANVWTHAAGVFVNNSLRHAYINGGSKGSNTTTIDPAPSGWNRTLVAARRNSTSAGIIMNGALAEVGYWSTDLSDDEVAMLAAGYSPLFVRPDKLVAYYPLFGRAGATNGEEDWAGNVALPDVADPPLYDHPRIIYPRRRMTFLLSGAITPQQRDYAPDAWQLFHNPR